MGEEGSETTKKEKYLSVLCLALLPTNCSDWSTGREEWLFWGLSNTRDWHTASLTALSLHPTEPSHFAHVHYAPCTHDHSASCAPVHPRINAPDSSQCRSLHADGLYKLASQTTSPLRHRIHAFAPVSEGIQSNIIHIVLSGSAPALKIFPSA